MKTALFALIIAIPLIVTPVCVQSGPLTKENVTYEEFLQLYFQVAFHEHEKKGSLNSFNLITFYPGTGPEDDLLFIIQTYNDNGQSTEDPQLRRQIRELGVVLLRNFQARSVSLLLKNRWLIGNPKTSLIINHVRVNDLQDTLAVTIDGVTSFDPADFKRGEQRVKMMGGVWAW